jgi:transposase
VDVDTELATLRNEVTTLRHLLGEKDKVVEALLEEIRFWKDKLFGRKSEKLSAFEREQMQLFNEAEEGAVGVVGPVEQATYRIAVRGHQRRGGGGVRKPLPASLPRVDVIHDIPESQKRTLCGLSRQKIGEEVHEELDWVPGSLRVIRHVRPRYVRPACEEPSEKGCTSGCPVVAIAAPAPSMVSKGMVGPGLLTQVVASKFVDSVPFYRQQKILRRHGIDLVRSTLCGWTLEAAGRAEVVKTLLWEQLLAGPIIQADETKLQVLGEPGRQNTTDSWMWVYRGGEPERPVVIFEYDPSRASRVPLERLMDYRGYLQTDGYIGYEAIGEREGIRHVGCLAHIRRKFEEARRVAPITGQASEALEFIRRIYEVESKADAQKLSAEQRREVRLRESKPILDALREWLDLKHQGVLPEGHLGKAIRYALGQWERMRRYLEDGRLRPDNNLAENAIRPFCVGRKNWLFSGSPRGAYASATLFTLIETAKANSLEPYHYLHHLFTNLPTVLTETQLLGLLPTNLTPAQIAPG